MGIDFSGFIANLGKTAASMQNDKEKIDTKTELNTYVSGWDAIKAKAEAENAQAATEDATNIQELEGQMKSELASLMGAEFGQKAGVQNKGTAKEPVFSDEDISLENMMALLEPEEGLDLAKVRENNEKPINIVEEMNVVENMNEFGFDPELTEVILEYEPAAAQYISDAIKDGSANRISKDIVADTEDAKDSKDLNLINYMKNSKDIFENTPFNGLAE